MTINELASGYLSLTGRPAATLSVCEYLEFVKLADGMSNVSSYQGRVIEDSVKEEPVVETILPDNRKMDQEQAPSSSELGALAPTIRDENPVSVLTAPKKTNPNEETKKTSRRSALDLLKSVSG